MYYDSTGSSVTSRFGDWGIMNSRVISINLPEGVDDSRITFSDPISYSLVADPDHPTQNQFSDRVCVWYDFSLGAWSNEGCRSQPGSDENNLRVVCECNHATTFGILVPNLDLNGLSPAVKAGLILLLVACVFIVLFHACRRDRTRHITFLLNLLLAIAGACFWFAISCAVARDVGKNGCATLGFLSHFFFVAQFTWIAVVAIHLGRACKAMSKDKRDMHTGHYIGLGWGLALTIAILYLVIHQLVSSEDISQTYGYSTEHRELCFIPEDNLGGLVGACLGPAILAMIAMLVAVARSRQNRRDWATYNDFTSARNNAYEFNVAIGVFVAVVFLWFFGALDLYVDSGVLPYIFMVVAILLTLYLLWFYVLIIPRAKEKVNIQRTHDDTQLQYLNTTGSSAATGFEGNYTLPVSPDNNTLSVVPQAFQRLSSPGMDEFNTPFERRAAFPSYHEEESGTDAVADEDDFDDLLFALQNGPQFEPQGESTVDYGEEEKKRSEDFDFDYGDLDVADTHL